METSESVYLLDEYIAQAYDFVFSDYLKNKGKRKKWKKLSVKKLVPIWKKSQCINTKDIKILNSLENIIVQNYTHLFVLTHISGHMQDLPVDQMKEFNIDEKEFNTPEFDEYLLFQDANGRTQYSISDFSLARLYNKVIELMEESNTSKKILILNELFKISHQRFDIPSLFIKEGYYGVSSLCGF